MTEDRVSKALRHLWWDTGVTVPPHHLGRGQHLWPLLRSSQSGRTHHSVTGGKYRGRMVRLQLSLGYFTCSHREALIWSSPLWWEEEATMSAVLPLSQTAGVWPPSVALGCGGPCPCLSSLQDNSRATKMWPIPTHAGERTREHTGESMTST